MSDIKFNMIGGGFQHENSSSAGSTPNLVEWVRDGSANISIHIDNGLRIPPNKTKLNYGWLSESKTIIGGIYGWCVNNIRLCTQVRPSSTDINSPASERVPLSPPGSP